MNSLGNFTAADWFITGQIVVIWFYIASKTGAWITWNVIKLFTGRSPKGKVETAINQILATYELKAGEVLLLETSDGWCLQISQRKGKQHDTEC
ncbi:DUF4752 family protein [Serratia sp. JSRIV004]|uniref:DUF4752 family protein n=1 Tax=Serratia sp. JSRIV004 TaxID=2831895 RepID=UPI001CBD4AD2|nr:DUF4752 family protein [Serratia sp. JSRIV004]UAN55464.1 DUF4752 family protein [Serratia sp. JSRIV004]UAN57277.1 DUF4752 family protein [Serratia sp. JSRIV004]